MDQDQELLDWLGKVSDVVIRKRADSVALSVEEQLVFEVWLLDVQACNGGLSQYFCNCGLAQWKKCLAATSAAHLASFSEFALQVERVISGARDPYKAIIKAGREAEDLYYDYQSKIVRDLRAAVGSKL